MRVSEIEKKALLLRGGQSVELNADWYRAVSVAVKYAHERCYLCDVDCLCVDDVADTCEWLNMMSNKFYCLTLAHKRLYEREFGRRE